MENSVVHSRKSNGLNERTIQSVQDGCCRGPTWEPTGTEVTRDVREVCKASLDGVWRSGLLEGAARRRTTRKIVMHVGGWDLLGCEGDDG